MMMDTYRSETSRLHTKANVGLDLFAAAVFGLAASVCARGVVECGTHIAYGASRTYDAAARSPPRDAPFPWQGVGRIGLGCSMGYLLLDRGWMNGRARVRDRTRSYR